MKNHALTEAQQEALEKLQLATKWLGDKKNHKRRDYPEALARYSALLPLWDQVDMELQESGCSEAQRTRVFEIFELTKPSLQKIDFTQYKEAKHDSVGAASSG